MRIFGASSIALLAAYGSIVVTAPAASAAYSDCPSGYFCAWTGKNGAGAMAAYQSGDPNMADGYGPQGMNNNIESVRNRTNNLWCYYDGANYFTGMGVVFSGNSFNLPPEDANKISSLGSSVSTSTCRLN